MGEVGKVGGQAWGAFLAPYATITGKSPMHYSESWGNTGEELFSGRSVSDFISPDYPTPDAPEPLEAPTAPKPEAPTEIGDEGIRKASMRRISKKRTLNHMYLTQGQDRDDMTLGGYRNTLAG